MQKTVDELSRELEEKEKIFNELRGEIASRDAEIDEKKKAVDELSREREEKEKILNEVERLRGEIASRDADISRRRKRG